MVEFLKWVNGEFCWVPWAHVDSMNTSAVANYLANAKEQGLLWRYWPTGFIAMLEPGKIQFA